MKGLSTQMLFSLLALNISAQNIHYVGELGLPGAYATLKDAVNAIYSSEHLLFPMILVRYTTKKEK